jgi:CheY-like chemotaxis protein
MTRETPLVLVVDDDPDFLEIHQHLLKSRGYAVHCCGGRHAALAYMAEERPDIIVTDLMMETLDEGVTLARDVKENPDTANLPVILITAAASARGFDLRPRNDEDLRKMYADAYFDKPVKMAELCSKISELLARSNES